MSHKNATHGMTGTPIYRRWQKMLQRCYDPKNNRFNSYGGRGIRVCEQWKSSFTNFFVDMFDGFFTGATLDRINNDGHYSPDHCRWVSVGQQARNRRDNRVIDTPKGRMLLCEAAEISGISRGVIEQRIKRGWPADSLFDKVDRGRRFFTQRIINTPQGSMPLYQASRLSGISKHTLLNRIKIGWSVSELFVATRRVN